MHRAGGPVLGGLGACFLGGYLLPLCILINSNVLSLKLLSPICNSSISSNCSLFNCCSLISGSKDPVLIFVIYDWNFK